MTTHAPMDIPVKPRVLIADDARIVRATLIKHIEGMFEFREAPDGEQAWEILLLDPHIRVVITDLTMPKLDGYGLLERIRASKISRIRDIPVIVVSGSDEQEERNRAKAAGADDLITKGIGTAQLLSRLDVLSKLVGSQQAFERGLEALVHQAPDAPARELPSAEQLHHQAAAILANALANRKNFVILNICMGLREGNHEGDIALPPPGVVDAVGQLLQRTVRQTDCVARTGGAEFTLATGSIHFDAARILAERVCNAIAGANLIADDGTSFIASCGVVSLSEFGATPAEVTLDQICSVAQQRAAAGLRRGVTGIVGPEEEAAFRKGV